MPRASRQEVAPAFLAQQALLNVVELGESGRDAGLDRTLAEQPRAEGMNRPGEEPLEIRQRVRDTREHARPAIAGLHSANPTSSLSSAS